VSVPCLQTSRIPLLLAITISFGAQAAPSNDWRLECVGRSSVALPPDVEMAALSYDSFVEEIGGGSRLSVSQFKDGQRAGWSQISYLNGLILVSNELDARQVADLRSLFMKQPELKREQLKKRDTAKSRATVVSDVELSSPQVMSWGYASHTLYLHQLQNHFLTTGFTNDSETSSASDETFDLFAKNVTYRQLFSIPRGNGVCLPYAFISDKGREPRDISISYRIKSHPDVMIVLTDANAEELDDSTTSSQTPEDEINDFWSQYEVKHLSKGFAFGAALLTVLGCKPGIAVSGEWKDECVGRSMFQLPPDVEVAAHAYREVADEMQGGNGLSEPQLPDGQNAGWSRFGYTGFYLISNPLSATEIKDVRTRFMKAKSALKDRLSNGKPSAEEKIVDIGTAKGNLAWSSQSNVRFLLQLNDHLISGRFGYPEKSKAENIELFKSFAERVVPRPMFSIPNEPGVCLPYSFIRDDGRHLRDVSATYRSKAYPDVSIIIQDSTPSESPSSPSNAKAQSQFVLNEFWSQYEHSETGRKVSAAWGPRTTQAVRIDGRKGLSTFVKIVRVDGSIDYAYSAHVSGGTETPDLTLHVIREANSAQARGTTSTGQKELLELAQRIVATIRRR